LIADKRQHEQDTIGHASDTSIDIIQQLKTYASCSRCISFTRVY